MEFFYRCLRPLVEPGLPGAGSSSYQSIISSVQKLAGEFPGLPREFLGVTQHAQHVPGRSPCPRLLQLQLLGNSECPCMHPPVHGGRSVGRTKRFCRGQLMLGHFLVRPARLTSRLCSLVGTDAFCFFHARLPCL